MREQNGIGRQRLKVERHKPHEKALQRDDVGPHHEFHGEAGCADQDKQEQNEVVEGVADVADPRDDHAPDPKRQQRGNHGEAGVDAEGLRQFDRQRHMQHEIADMAEQHENQGAVEGDAEQPDPLVGLIKALEDRHFAQHPERRSNPRCGRGRRRDFQGNGRPGVLNDAQEQPARKQGRGCVEYNRVNSRLHGDNPLSLSLALRCCVSWFL